MNLSLYCKSLFPLFVLFVSCTSNCFAQSQLPQFCYVQGAIKGFGTGYLQGRIYSADDAIVLDSIQVVNDTIRHRILLGERQYVEYGSNDLRLFRKISGRSGARKSLVLLPSNTAHFGFEAVAGDTVYINGTIDSVLHVQVSGSPANDEINLLAKETWFSKLQLDTLSVRRLQIPEQDDTVTEAKINRIKEQIRDAEDRFIARNRGASLAHKIVFDRLRQNSIHDQLPDSSLQRLWQLIDTSRSSSALRVMHRWLSLRDTYRLGQQFPPMVSLPTPDNQQFTADFSSHEYTLIDFWDTWCGPCMADMPAIKKLAEAYPGRLQVIGVSSGHAPEMVKKLVTKKGYNWPQVFTGDAPGNMREQLSIVAIPTSIIVDKEGKIIARFTGETEKALELLKKLLDISKPAPPRRGF